MKDLLENITVGDVVFLRNGKAETVRFVYKDRIYYSINDNIYRSDGTTLLHEEDEYDIISVNKKES